MTVECRILTVREPYASLLVHGMKQYETRPQPQSFRGLVFIVAGQFKSGDLRAVGEQNRQRLIRAGCKRAASGTPDVTALDPEWFAKLPRGAVIGAVRLADCRSCLDVIEDQQLGDAEEVIGNWADDNFALRVEHAVVFQRPVPCRGVLGLTTPKQPLQDELFAELRRSCTGEQIDLLTGMSVEVDRRAVA